MTRQNSFLKTPEPALVAGFFMADGRGVHYATE
jgi:hypothetical protein